MNGLCSAIFHRPFRYFNDVDVFATRLNIAIGLMLGYHGIEEVFPAGPRVLGNADRWHRDSADDGFSSRLDREIRPRSRSLRHRVAGSNFW